MCIRDRNGRAIFNFAVLSVPKQIQSLLDEMKMKNDQIDIFLFHQATKYVLDMLCKKLDIPCEKIPIRLKEQGNTVSSSIPFLFEKYLNAENINTILMSGFGVGLSIATCLLQKR